MNSVGWEHFDRVRRRRRFPGVLAPGSLLLSAASRPTVLRLRLECNFRVLSRVSDRRDRVRGENQTYFCDVRGGLQKHGDGELNSSVETTRQ